MTKYGYCRVARIDGDNLETQKQIMQGELCDEIIADVHSGIKRSTALNELLAKFNKGDTLVISSLSRLSRQSNDVLMIMKELFSKGVKVHILDTGQFSDSTTSNIFLNMFESVVEMERNYRLEILKEGKEIAKQSEGFSEGRPKKYTPEELDRAMLLLESKTYDEVAAETNISRSTLIREKKKRKNLHNN